MFNHHSPDKNMQCQDTYISMNRNKAAAPQQSFLLRTLAIVQICEIMLSYAFKETAKSRFVIFKTKPDLKTSNCDGASKIFNT